MGKLDYAERQEDRKERLEGAADRARSDAERAFASSDRIADAIPLGQPILVGHHSEGHHRRDIARNGFAMRPNTSAELRPSGRAASVRTIRRPSQNSPPRSRHSMACKSG